MSGWEYTMANGHQGEIALVTGANKGIGREIARRLAQEGMTVYIGCRGCAHNRARGRGSVMLALTPPGGPTATFIGHAEDGSAPQPVPW